MRLVPSKTKRNEVRNANVTFGIIRRDSAGERISGAHNLALVGHHRKLEDGTRLDPFLKLEFVKMVVTVDAFDRGPM